MGSGGENGNGEDGLYGDLGRSLDIANKSAQLLRSLGIDTTRVGAFLNENLRRIAELCSRSGSGQADQQKVLSLPDAEAFHFLISAAGASDPDLQKMFASLLACAADPERRHSRVAQDAKTLGFFTATPASAALLCYLVKKWPHGCQIAADELAQAMPVQMSLEEIQDSLNVLVQARCMSVSDSNFQSGESLTLDGGNLRSGQIFVKSNQEEFRVTALGRRIVELYGPAGSDDSPRSTEPSRASKTQAD